MGSDDLFHKRRAKKADELARCEAGRKPYPKALIVCEGSKTKPNYFNGLKDRYSLSSFEVSGYCGSSPCSVFKYAKDRYWKEKNAGDEFDRVYCVFDKDDHANYQRSLNDIRQAKPKAFFMRFARCHALNIGCYCISGTPRNLTTPAVNYVPT